MRFSGEFDRIFFLDFGSRSLPNHPAAILEDVLDGAQISFCSKKLGNLETCLLIVRKKRQQFSKSMSLKSGFSATIASKKKQLYQHRPQKQLPLRKLTCPLKNSGWKIILSF